MCVAGCSLLGPGELPQGEASREWRAAWVLNIPENIRNTETAHALVKEARDLNLNTLFVAAVYQGTACYPSQVAPAYVPPGSPRPLEFDPLQAMIDAAHEDGGRPMQVFAWVNFCNVWEQRGLIPPNHPVIQHPDWLTAHYDPNRAPDVIPEFWLDPGVPAVELYGAEICRELAMKYNIDGILLDSVEYRPGGFGYNPTALQRFAHETGRLDRPAPKDAQWQGWRMKQVTHVVERMALGIRSQRPGLAIAVVGSADGPFPARYEDSMAYAQLGQNWPAWMEADLADILVLRDFKRQANQQQAREYLDWLKFAAIERGEKALICGISGRDNTLLGTQTQVLASRASGAQGMAFWRYRDNNTEGRPSKALFELLESKVLAARARPPELPWLKKIRTGMVAGQVLDTTQVPMSNVRVQFPSLRREAYSHPDGLYVLFGVEGGTSVDPQGYRAGTLYPAEEPVTVKPGLMVVTNIAVTE